MPSKDVGVCISRRRERSTTQLHNAMSRVNDQMSAVPALHSQMEATDSSSPSGQTKKQVRRECLRFPRSTADLQATMRATPELSTSSTAFPKDGEVSLLSCGSSSAELTDQLEDLRLQNAVLRKSLAMLQQSVVDSMKGNKAQFMGNGIFRTKKGPDDATSGLRALGHPGAVHDVDLEGLRASLAERREALKATVAERDEALRVAESTRHELAAAQAKNEALEAQLAESQAKLEEVKGQLLAAEDERQRAMSRTGELEQKSAKLSDELLQLQGVLSEAQSQSSGLMRDLESMHAERSSLQDRYKCLEDDHAAVSVERDIFKERSECFEGEVAMLRSASAAGTGKVSRLVSHRHELAERKLAGLARRSAASECFLAWSACCSASREESFEQRIEGMERERAVLVAELETARSSGTAAESRIAALDAEVAALTEAARGMEEALDTARRDAASFKAQADEAREHASALNQNESEAGKFAEQERDAALEKLRLSEDRVAGLQRELDDARGSGESALEDLHVQLKESRDREVALKKEVELSVKALEQARKAELLAKKAADEAKKKATDLESQLQTLAGELETTRSEALRSATESAEARRKSDEAESRATVLQRRVDDLVKQAVVLEASEKARGAEVHKLTEDNVALQRDLTMLQTSLKSTQAAAGREDALAKEIADMRMSLAEARSAAKSSAEKAKMLQNEKSSLAKTLEDTKAESAKAADLSAVRLQFHEDARKALEEARQSVRIMVTAPKVAVNIGGNDVNIHVPFPFDAIKESVRKELVPRYSKVFAVAETAGDSEIRKEVQAMVEDMASSLQCKILELMPQAEGTCNWDGFGAKCGSLAVK